MRSVIQNVRGALAREARTLAGADVVVQSGVRPDAAVRRTIDDARRHDRRTSSAARSSRRRRWCGRQPRARRRRGWWSCWRSTAAFRSTGASRSRTDVRTRTDPGERGALVRPGAAGPVEPEGRRSARHRPRDVRDSRRARRRAGPSPRHVLARAARAHRRRRSRAHGPAHLRQPGALSDPAARARRAACAPLVRTLRDRFRNNFVSARSYRDTEERVGRELADRRELPEPRRLRHRRARRHRRLERDARLHPAEDSHHRGAQVRRRHRRAHPRRLRRAGAAARRRRQRARPGARRHRDAVRPGAARSRRSAASSSG